MILWPIRKLNIDCYPEAAFYSTWGYEMNQDPHFPWILTWCVMTVANDRVQINVSTFSMGALIKGHHKMVTHISNPIIELFLFLNSLFRKNSKNEVTLNQTGMTDRIVNALGFE